MSSLEEGVGFVALGSRVVILAKTRLLRRAERLGPALTRCRPGGGFGESVRGNFFALVPDDCRCDKGNVPVFTLPSPPPPSAAALTLDPPAAASSA